MHALPKRYLAPLLVLCVAIPATVACGGSSSSSPSSSSSQSGTAKAAVQPPPSVKSARQIVYCTAPPYAPVIMQNGNNFSGSDIDIGNAIAQLMGVKAQWIAIGFDGFIAAVKSGKCDAYLGASTDTAQRAKAVHFTDYVTVGRDYLVKKGNPAGIHSEADLCGHSISMLIGTTEQKAVQAASTKCKSQGKPGVNLQIFDQDATAGLALVEGKVDAYVSDAPGLLYYVKKYPGRFEIGLPKPVDTAPWGIATRLDNAPLNTALKQAVHLLYTQGTMRQLLGKWGLTLIAFSSPPSA